MSFLFRQRSKFKNYDHIARINTNAPVTALSLSGDGNLIAVGSANGLAIYRGDAALTAPVFEAMYGAVQVIAWYQTPTLGDLVVFVARSSWVYIWSNAEGPDVFLSKCEYRASDTDSLTCVSICSATPSCLRIAVGTTRGSVIIHEYDLKANNQKHISSIGLDFYPQALMFESSASSLLAVGKDNGKMTRVDIDKTEFTWESHVSPRATSATFTAGNLVVDNAVNGFSTFRVDTGEHQHTYRPPRRSGAAIIQASHTPNGRWLICGSDHGKVYVYDTQQVRLQDTFTHASEGILKYISVADCEDGHIIASALDTEVFPKDDPAGVGLGHHKSSFVTIWKTSKVAPRNVPMQAQYIHTLSGGPLLWLFLGLNIGCVCFTIACIAYGSATIDRARDLVWNHITVPSASEPVVVVDPIPPAQTSTNAINRIHSTYQSLVYGRR